MKILKCPSCGNQFSIEKDDGNEDIIFGELKCNCSDIKRIEDGVLILNKQEQKGMNEWSKMDEMFKLENLDKMVTEKVPPSQKAFSKKIMRRIGKEIITYKPKWLLDVASGRGALMKYLLEQPEIKKTTENIILTDLSPLILQYDRKKFSHLVKDIKVNYIACDATNLPFIHEKIDIITSFFGYANMGSVMPKALKLVPQILKKEGIFLNSAIFIQEVSEAFEKIKEFYESHEAFGAEKYILHDPTLLLHDSLGLSQLFVETIASGIGEKNELDLIPYEGEEYQVCLIKGIK